jgi:molybdate transport system permease protein
VNDAIASALLSVEVAALATLFATPIAVPLGLVLSRRHFAGKSVLATFLLLPLVLPPVVTGALLLRLLSRTAPLGRALGAIGITVPLTLLGAVLAALVVGLPLYVLAARAAFDAVDRAYEEAALALGATPAATLARVTIPLAMPGLAAGALLAFARALGEFGATIVLAGNVTGETRTLSVAVYALLDAPDGEARTLPFLGCSVALSLVSVVGYEALLRWQGRRMGTRT